MKRPKSSSLGGETLWDAKGGVATTFRFDSDIPTTCQQIQNTAPATKVTLQLHQMRLLRNVTFQQC